MESRLPLLPLLSPAETKLAETVKSYLRDVGFEGRVFHKAQPSTFLCVDAIPPELGILKPTAFTGRIFLAIVRGGVRSRIVAAILGSDSDDTKPVEVLLRYFGIPAHTGALDEEPSAIVSFLGQALRVRPSQEKTKRVTNLSERWLLDLSHIALGHTVPESVLADASEVLRQEVAAFEVEQRRKLPVFHEVPLAAFINLGPGQVDVSIDWEYARKARLDMLVTAEVPDYTPLLAVEFDGPSHETPEGQRKDRKKEAVLRFAGLPLLRVGYEDAPEVRSDNVVAIHGHQLQRAKNTILIGLIQRTVEVLYRERITERNSWVPDAEVLALSPKGDVREKREAIAAHFFYAAADIAGDSQADAAMRRADLDPAQNPEIQTAGAVLDDFRYQRTGAGGTSCSASFVHGGTAHSCRTPFAVHYRGFGSWNLDFDQIVQEELRIWLIRAAADWLSGNATNSR